MKVGSSGSASLPADTVAKRGLIALQRDFATGATSPVNVVVDGPPNAPQTRQGLARLRYDLGGDRDFAAGALTVQTAPRIAVASLPLSIEPSTERASAAIDRLRDDYVPRAFGKAANRVSVGGEPAEARDGFAVDGGCCQS